MPDDFFVIYQKGIPDNRISGIPYFFTLIFELVELQEQIFPLKAVRSFGA